MFSALTQILRIDSIACLKSAYDVPFPPGPGLREADTVAFVPVQCSDLLSVTEFVRDLGPGEPPAT